MKLKIYSHTQNPLEIIAIPIDILYLSFQKT